MPGLRAGDPAAVWVWGGTSQEERMVPRKKARTAGLTDASMVS
jgi:hypothetical protein